MVQDSRKTDDDVTLDMTLSVMSGDGKYDVTNQRERKT